MMAACTIETVDHVAPPTSRLLMNDDQSPMEKNQQLMVAQHVSNSFFRLLLSQRFTNLTQTGKSPMPNTGLSLIKVNEADKIPKPKWHAPWELSTVISGHLGWVRSITFDPSNEWFVTGSADRTIKVNNAQLRHCLVLRGI
jgi:WD40 repeat protein